MRSPGSAVGFVLVSWFLGTTARADETFRSHVVVCQEGEAAEADVKLATVLDAVLPGASVQLR